MPRAVIADLAGQVPNSEGQRPGAFKTGQYALANILCHPTKDLMVGLAGQWGQCQNKSDGWTFNDVRLQFTGRFSYEVMIKGGN